MMNGPLFTALVFFVWPGCLAAQSIRYEANWESIDKRSSPQWFDDGKFGIFVVWGLYSVPAYAPPAPKEDTAYAETYWLRLMEGDPRIKDYKDGDGVTNEFHRKTYGSGFRYQDFVPMFTVQLFNPDQWASLFAQSGARYVVFTAKYNDGYALWPSPESWNWNSVDLQPHRDLVGELSKAVVAQGLKMGFYYNLHEPFNPVCLKDPRAYVELHMIPQMKDLVVSYRPSILWTDWPQQPSSVYESPQFLAWLFNDSPVKDEVVVNDRWGTDTGSRHGGFYTSEYGITGMKGAKMAPSHKWEENQGMGKSYGYNRMEGAADYKSATALMHLLVDTVSNGGNLLLDVGPTADGRIPVIMQDRLLQMGAWLKINGEAIYGTRPWRQVSEGDVRYTSKGDAVYAIAETWPTRELVLRAPRPTSRTMVTLLGGEAPLKWRQEGGKLHIDAPPIPRSALALPEACVFKLNGVN